MGDKTGIEWTDATWNPVRGCSRVSEGCRHCYAEHVAARFSGPGQPYEGLADRDKPGSKWTGQVRLIEKALRWPLRWKKRRRIFVNSMSDLFHDALPDEAIDRVFAVMALSPAHTFQILTKRADRMKAYCDGQWARREALGNLMAEIGGQYRGGWYAPESDASRGWVGMHVPLPNVWLGVSVEDQKAADSRIPLLLQTPAAKRFLSCEPLLGPVDLSRCGKHYTGSGPLHLWKTDLEGNGGWRKQHGAITGEDTPEIDWVICGGESGRGDDIRPMHPDWARALRDQCAAAGVPFFFKQWGEWAPVTVDDDGYGGLGPAYPIPGCSDTGAHRDQECLFWQGERLVHWPHVETTPAVGARRVGKKAAGALLDGREHKEVPR